MRRKWLVFSLAILSALGIVGALAAHGVETEYRLFVENGVVQVEVCAVYDMGSPMSEAQVAIFAPDDLENPWKTGKTDKAGCFTFLPDLSMPGSWDVQVRLAGHGKMVHIEITGDEASAAKSDAEETRAEKETAEPREPIAGAGTAGTGFTTGQIVIMAACVVWGGVGTALFFASRRKE